MSAQKDDYNLPLKDWMLRAAALAAVIEQANSILDDYQTRTGGWPQLGCDLHAALTADTDAALREVRAKAWDEGNTTHRHAIAYDGDFQPYVQVEAVPNPYREATHDE